MLVLTNTLPLERFEIYADANYAPYIQAGTVEHTEHWTLHKNVKVAAWTDEELDRVVLPLTRRP